MQIDYNSMTFTYRGREFTVSSFKKWYKDNYQPILHKYHISGDTFDWHAILSDVQTNGIIQIFYNEN